VSCALCDTYPAGVRGRIDDAGHHHRTALDAIRADERAGRSQTPDRWPLGWSADAAHWTAPDPTHSGGRA
jgi:hypothetical protein